MGVLDKIFRRKKKEPELAYYLQCQPLGQKGWVPVERFDFPASVEDCKGYMTEPGVYNLQKRVSGRIGGYVWEKPFVVKGEKGQIVASRMGGGGTESDKIAQAIETDMVRAVRWFKLPDLIQQAMRKAFGGENPFLGGGNGGGQGVTARTVKDAIKSLKEEYEDLHGMFGSTTDTVEQRMKVKGELPAWLVYLPQIADQMGDTIEKRLDKWGLIGSPTGGRRLLTMPDKPVRKRKLDLTKLKRKKEEKVEKGEKKVGEKPEK